MQRHNARLISGLNGSFNTEPIVWRGPEWGAPFYFPYFYYKSKWSNAEIIHCDDAVTALVGAKIKSASRKKVIATVHGLDVILPIEPYQKILRSSLKKLDKIICVSNYTAQQVESRGVSREKIEVIPNSAEKVQNNLTKSEDVYNKIRHQTGIGLKGKKILFSLGRPLRRKGFDWFAKNIHSRLPENVVYIVAGPKQKIPLWIKSIAPFLKKETLKFLMIASGCDSVHDKLLAISEKPGVYYLNDITEELRELLFVASDLFIMPNRSVFGDMEGFGIVALEAAIRGVPVIATGIEGITDAVIDGENGYCVEEGNESQMIEMIKKLLENESELSEFGKRAKIFAENRFSPEKIYAGYEKIFEALMRESRN